MQKDQLSIENSSSNQSMPELSFVPSEQDKKFVCDHARSLVESIAKGRLIEIQAWWKKLENDERLLCTLEYLGCLLHNLGLTLFQDENQAIVLMEAEGHTIFINSPTESADKANFNKVRESLAVGIALFDLYSG